MGSLKHRLGINMSTLARSYVKFLQQAKTASTSLGQVRSMSAGHDPDGWKMWKKMFFLVVIPVIVLGHVNAFGMADGSAHIPPPYVPYDHLPSEPRVSPGAMATTPSSTTPTSMLSPLGTNMERRSIKQSVGPAFCSTIVNKH